MNRVFCSVRLPAKVVKCLLAFVVTASLPLRAEEWREAVALEGLWKFEIGDNPAYADPSFDDSDWEQIRVPHEWERQGFPGYDGYAWYRTSFRTPAEAKEYQLYLLLGQIDDVDEAYLNGRMIGYQGSFPPDYTTGYNISRHYPVPPGLLRAEGENVLAVRVYDDEIAGGIVHGDIGLFYARDQLQVALDLSGSWRLKFEDDLQFARRDYEDSSWQQVFVPGIWDGYDGRKDYDGVGWYRTRFRLPENLRKEKLILALGKIDDVEEVYLNGKLVGKTGTWFARRGEPEIHGDEYNKQRAYFISPEMLLPGEENVLAVRVYDAMLHGGIWDGPIGLVTRKQYLRWSEQRSPFGEIFQQLFKR